MDEPIKSDTSILCFLNRPLGERILIDLLGRPELHVGLVVLHEERDRDFRSLSGSAAIPALSWGAFMSEWLPAHGQEDLFSHGVSVLFGHRLPPEVLRLCRKGVLNFHPSYLPFGRGAHPAAWAIWNEEPYGATLHLMDDTLDTGPILNQVSISIHATDTSDSLYEKSLNALWDLYGSSALQWLRGNEIQFHPQQGTGSSHSIADLATLTNLELTSSMSVGRAIQWLRARTFGTYDGAQFQIGGEQYGVTVRVYSSHKATDS